MWVYVRLHTHTHANTRTSTNYEYLIRSLFSTVLRIKHNFFIEIVTCCKAKMLYVLIINNSTKNYWSH
jgi:hypothetical protein